MLGLTHMAYILAALLFIMALAGLSKQETAKWAVYLVWLVWPLPY